MCGRSATSRRLKGLQHCLLAAINPCRQELIGPARTLRPSAFLGGVQGLMTPKEH